MQPLSSLPETHRNEVQARTTTKQVPSPNSFASDSEALGNLALTNKFVGTMLARITNATAALLKHPEAGPLMGRSMEQSLTSGLKLPAEEVRRTMSQLARPEPIKSSASKVTQASYQTAV